ncbi:hypothetical protein ACFPOD_15065 [Nitratireductor kimnyeongensis]|uniref:Holin-X, holin superfamily III n=1 Tax=Nitratireductor kimnyeongensis TaxID=430679 RepID=A0ABW0TC40_9HYPH|nr:hypothetical protein [Nitratireductor kimnyeongensis]
MTSLAAGEFSSVFKRMKVATGFYALAALLGLFGLGFLVLAGFIAASREWGVLEASLGFGIAFVAMALVVLVSLKVWTRIQVRRARRRRVSDAGVLAGTAALTLLPSVLSRTGRLGTIALPVLAVLGYAIFRENSGQDPDNH